MVVPLIPAPSINMTAMAMASAPPNAAPIQITVRDADFMNPTQAMVCCTVQFELQALESTCVKRRRSVSIHIFDQVGKASLLIAASLFLAALPALVALVSNKFMPWSLTLC
jgi:hypothetical protein